jgi:hypothetical protein
MILVGLWACAREEFEDLPGELVVPSLGGCTWYETSPGVSVSDGSENDQEWTYDREGRLVEHLEGYETAGADEHTDTFTWRGGCNTRIDAVYESGLVLVQRTACDAHDNPISITVTREDGERPEELADWTYVNRYDALGQLTALELYEDGELLTSETRVWNGQGQLLQREVYDPVVGFSVKRLFYWDRVRLLGWEDRGPQDDPWMERLYFGRTLLAEYDYIEEPPPRKSTEYEVDRGEWPTARTVESSYDNGYTQEIEVDCSER